VVALVPDVNSSFVDVVPVEDGALVAVIAEALVAEVVNVDVAVVPKLEGAPVVVLEEPQGESVLTGLLPDIAPRVYPPAARGADAAMRLSGWVFLAGVLGGAESAAVVDGTVAAAVPDVFAEGAGAGAAAAP